MEPDRRIRHSPLLIFLLGGLLGSGLNFAVSLWFHQGFAWNPFLSFFAGTLLNLLFHHLYHYFLNANCEIRMRTPLPLQGLLYVAVVAGSTLLLWLFLRRLGMSFPLGMLCSIGVLSALSVLVIRVSTFGAAQLAEVDYRELDEDYYDEQTDPAKVSRFRAWYHRSRYERLDSLCLSTIVPGCESLTWAAAIVGGTHLRRRSPVPARQPVSSRPLRPYQPFHPEPPAQDPVARSGFALKRGFVVNGLLLYAVAEKAAE